MEVKIRPVIVFLALLANSLFAQPLTWHWSNPLPHGNDVVGMAWNGVTGVQVCELGRVYTSPDMVNWYPQNSGFTNSLQAAAFFGNRIIIAGANGSIAFSDDGVSFTNCSVPSSNWLVSIAASPGRAVIVGDNGALYTSGNGATWTLQSPPPQLSPSWLTSVAYGNGEFVTTGDTGGSPGGSYLANSKDGVHWTNQTVANATLLSGLGNLETVSWVNASGSSSVYPYSGFWAVDDAGNAIYSTNNGINWKKFALLDSTNVLYTVAADSASGLLAGDGEVRLGQVASNLLTWPPQTGSASTTVPAWTYFSSVTATNGVYELAGSDGMLVQSFLTNGDYSWNTPYNSVRDWLWQVTTGNGLYVAVGDNVRVLTSPNGADWTTEQVPLTNSVSAAKTVFLCVGGTTNLLLAAGTAGSLAISPNVLIPVTQTNTDGTLFTNEVGTLGIIWDSLPAPAGTTNDLAGVAAFDNQFFIVGGNGTLLNSSDGASWTALDSGTNVYLSGIAAGTNGLLVLTGNEGAILTSPDGIHWTARDSGTTNWLYRVRCVGGHLLAVGEHGTLLASTNGSNWTRLTSGVTNWLNDAVMVSNTCYVVGNQGVVLASTNFTDWSNPGSISTKSLDGVATQNGQLVTVGFEGTILRSQILPITTPVVFTDFAQSAGYNIFSVAGTLDEQFTLDSTTNLTNWVTGPLLNLIYGDGTLIFYQSLDTAPSAAQYYRCTPVP
jgi:hypothetical protein